MLRLSLYFWQARRQEAASLKFAYLCEPRKLLKKTNCCVSLLPPSLGYAITQTHIDTQTLKHTDTQTHTHTHTPTHPPTHAGTQARTHPLTHAPTHAPTHASTHRQLLQNPATQSVRFTSVKRSSRNKKNAPSRGFSLSKTCCVFHTYAFSHTFNHVCRTVPFPNATKHTAPCKRSYQIIGGPYYSDFGAQGLGLWG